jgi:membrane protein YdbS with pleckstrin-like domain
LSQKIGDSTSVLWQGKPWIIPAAIGRSIVVIVVAVLFVWLEFFAGAAEDVLFGVNIIIWTLLAFFVVWLISITGLLIVRATNQYNLKSDSIEIRTGILTSRSSVIVASGFSDLEVIRGVAGRILEYGDIIIRTQSERDPEKMMVKVRNPLTVAEQIRYVMGRQIVRLDQSPPAETKY